MLTLFWIMIKRESFIIKSDNKIRNNLKNSKRLKAKIIHLISLIIWIKQNKKLKKSWEELENKPLNILKINSKGKVNKIKKVWILINLKEKHRKNSKKF
jgi:hypothetical protein